MSSSFIIKKDEVIEWTAYGQATHDLSDTIGGVHKKF